MTDINRELQIIEDEIANMIKRNQSIITYACNMIKSLSDDERNRVARTYAKYANESPYIPDSITAAILLEILQRYNLLYSS